jgi:hypothetical protein
MNVTIYKILYFQHQTKLPFLNIKNQTCITLIMAHVNMITPFHQQIYHQQYGDRGESTFH